MGTNYGTSIPRNGMVLHLDAANKKSYPGTGTTWYDLSGKNYHATLFNSPTHNNFFMSFNGVDSYGQIDNGLQTDIQNARDFTIITFSNIKLIEHVDNIVGWGNANADGDGYVRTFGQYANQTSLRTSYNGPDLGTGELLNKNLMLVSRYDADVLYSDTYGSVRNSNSIDFTGSTSQSWKDIPTSYPITIAKTSYWTRWMEVDISAILMYDRFLSEDEIQEIYNAYKGRYGL